MASYVLHIPTERNPVPAILDKYGLQSLAENCSYGLDVGPEGKHGVMLSWYGLDDGPPPGAERTWQQLPGKPDVWMGVEVNRPLIPHDIARRRFLPGGEFVLCADGNAWFVPVATKLPHRGRHNERGEFERVVCDQYQEFYARSQENYSRLLKALDQTLETGEDTDLSWHEAYEFCWQAIGMNYRVTPEILDALGVLTDTVVSSVISVIMCQEDISSFAFKKKQLI